MNCFMSLFYVAFYLQDMRLLQSVSCEGTGDGTGCYDGDWESQQKIHTINSSTVYIFSPLTVYIT